MHWLLCMCDCYMHLSRWELPPPSSKSYWDGVCGEIEKKYKRVRPSYSTSQPFVPSILKPPISDDIKFKISPPTSMHESRTVTFKVESDRYIPATELTHKNHQNLDPKTNLKLPLANFKRHKASVPEADAQAFESIKIYTKQSCQRHKSLNAKTIPDEEISQFLQAKSSVQTLPVVRAEKKILCEHRKVVRSKSASASLMRLKSKQLSECEPKKTSKAPKLGAASLLPSFAKAVSIDSSTGTRESLDSELESTSSQTKVEVSPVKRDFLGVPNLRFVSSHPSFQKLSHIDSSDEDETESQDLQIDSGEEIFVPEKKPFKEEKVVEFKIPDEKAQTLDPPKTKVEKPAESEKKKVSKDDFEKKFYNKALDIVTKCKFSKMFNEIDFSAKSSSAETEKLKKSDSVDIKFRRLKFDETPLDFKEISRKLKENARNNLAMSQS